MMEDLKALGPPMIAISLSKKINLRCQGIAPLPRREKSAPTSPPIGHRVSAAIKTRDRG